jgi:hypothetical protein
VVGGISRTSTGFVSSRENSTVHVWPSASREICSGNCESGDRSTDPWNDFAFLKALSIHCLFFSISEETRDGLNRFGTTITKPFSTLT